MSLTDPTHPVPARGAKTFAVITVVVALVAGVMIGVVGDRVWMWRHHGPSDRAMRGMTQRLLSRFDRELGLTTAQHDQIRGILEQHRTRMSTVFATISPQITKEIDQANREIENVLSPEQRSKFEAMKLRVHPPGSGRPGPPRE